MKKRLFIFALLLMVSAVTFQACDEDGDFNIFTLEQDRQFGEDFDQQLRNSGEYDILKETNYPDAYKHLRRIKNDLLQSDEFIHKEDFNWEVTIIKDDEVLNAFAVPGGKMYFYTGIIKYLDNEAQFGGVMAHEMAHVDKRHSTERMTKTYGYKLLISLLLGENPSQWEEIAADLALGLGTLKFSRDDEYEADEFAVKFSADTDLYPKGVAGFFEKLEGSSRPPEFLSTHPSPENRIEKIDEVWKSIGSPGGDTFVTRYQEFQNSLP